MTCPDDVMESFLALAQCAGVATDTGEIVAQIPDAAFPGYRERVIPPEHVDDLFARGWLVSAGEDGDECEGTEKGLYWLTRWLQKRERKPRRAA